MISGYCAITQYVRQHVLTMYLYDLPIFTSYEASGPITINGRLAGPPVVDTLTPRTVLDVLIGYPSTRRTRSTDADDGYVL